MPGRQTPARRSASRKARKPGPERDQARPVAGDAARHIGSGSRARAGDAAGPAAALSRTRGAPDRRKRIGQARRRKFARVSAAGGGRLDRAGARGRDDRRSAAPRRGEDPAPRHRGGIRPRFRSLPPGGPAGRALFDGSPAAAPWRPRGNPGGFGGARTRSSQMEGAAASELAENMRDDGMFRVPALDWTRTSARADDRMDRGNAVCATPRRAREGHDPKRIAQI